MPFTDTFTVYEEYYSNPDLVRADYAWEQGETDEISILKDGQKEFAPGTVKGKPIFEEGVLESLGQPSFKTWRRNGGTMVAKTSNWTAIIPGGFRGGNTPNKMNPISFDIGEYSALMGLIHVIAIPNKRITNCVTVTEEDIPHLMEGIHLLDTAFNLLADGTVDEIGSLRWQLAQTGSVTMKDGREKSMKVTEDDFIPECKDNFNKLPRDSEIDPVKDPWILLADQDTDLQQMIDGMKMEVTCHAGPMSSIRKLHLHGFTSDYKTVAWQKMEEKAQSEYGRVKNTPIKDVILMAEKWAVEMERDKSLMAPPNPPSLPAGRSRVRTRRKSLEHDTDGLVAMQDADLSHRDLCCGCD